MIGAEVKNLYVNYGEKAVFSGFNAAFEKNKINVVLGSSGVGKSTLLNVLAGLKDYGGDVAGTENGVSYIFQKDRLIPTISVYKNLDLVLRSKYKNKRQRKETIEKMLSDLEISEHAAKLPTELSGGEAQRAAIARAFLYPSGLLLLDEPFKALDTALKARLFTLFAKLNEDNPRTVVFVTHAIDECLLAADRYIVLGGCPAEIIAEGGIDIPQQDRTLKDKLLDGVRLNLLDALY